MYSIHESFNILKKYDVILENIHTKCRYKIDDVSPSIVTMSLCDDSYRFFNPNFKYSLEYEPSLKLQWDYKKIREHFVVWDNSKEIG